MSTAMQLMLFNAIQKHLSRKPEKEGSRHSAGKLLAVGFALGAITTACAGYAVCRTVRRRAALPEALPPEDELPEDPDAQ